MATITNSQPAGPTTEEQIAKFEQHVGHKLPADYRAFLLEHNGGKPEPDAFKFNLWSDDPEDEEENVVLCFFPMQDLSVGTVEVEEMDELPRWPLHCAWEDLQHDLVEIYERELDDTLLPIGTDGSTNYFCLALDGPRTGSLLFLESEEANTVVLADSFDAFLASLTPRERDDYADEL